MTPAELRKRRVSEIFDMVIEEGSLVPSPANPAARVAFFKEDRPANVDAIDREFITALERAAEAKNPADPQKGLSDLFREKPQLFDSYMRAGRSRG